MNRYNKLTMIGKGTFGSVWLVESRASGSKYAVKELSVRTMSDTDRHLALNEVKILSTLKHKNIIRYKDALQEGINFYIVMEFAEGGDLYTRIKQSKGLFQQEQILDWFTQLLLALKHIHGFNVLHRDLKTQNIFLTKSNVVKLGDFGIARILDSTTDHAQTTVGTPYYLSPEICQQQPIYGPLLQDLIDILLRAKPQDRPSAKQLLYAPAMKPYVEKFAVIQRERIDSVASTANERRTSAEVKPSNVPPKCEQRERNFIDGAVLTAAASSSKPRRKSVVSEFGRLEAAHRKRAQSLEAIETAHKPPYNSNNVMSRPKSVAFSKEKLETAQNKRAKSLESVAAIRESPSKVNKVKPRPKSIASNTERSEATQSRRAKSLETVAIVREIPSNVNNVKPHSKLVASNTERLELARRKRTESLENMHKVPVEKRNSKSVHSNIEKLEVVQKQEIRNQTETLKKEQSNVHYTRVQNDGYMGENTEKILHNINVVPRINKPSKETRLKEDQEPSIGAQKFRVEVTIHEQPKPRTSQDNKQHMTFHREPMANENKQSVVANSLDAKQKIAMEATAADRVRQSILKEHARRRRSSTACARMTEGGEIQFHGAEVKEKVRRKPGRIQSESSSHLPPKHKSTDRKNYTYKKLDVNDTKETKINQRHSEVKSNDIQSRKNNIHTRDSSKEDLKPTEYQQRHSRRPPNEKNNANNPKQELDAQDGHKAAAVDINSALEALRPEKPKKSYRRIMDSDQFALKSRDKTGSVPGVREARVRRQAARESLDQHMNHCLRARKNSKRSGQGISCEQLDKENVCPLSKNGSSRFKTVNKRKAIPPLRENKVDMIDSSEVFKRCETYKVAQFRRLPLMSVPDVTEYAVDSKSSSNAKQAKNRHKSESSLNHKLPFSKFKGIRGVQIERARRRAKKITTNVEVESARSEFSIKPDCAGAVEGKSPSHSHQQAKDANQIDPLNKIKDKPRDSQASQLKFEFRGKTLHLNATDAKSMFAHIEALRVFLEENLGTERFIEAYQYLNGSSLFSLTKGVFKDDAGLERILGKEKRDYSDLLCQLITTEANHFGTSV
ncbi:Serine/threonine-protein kinase Nek1 [Exaiptasia diaphana]|nr:Serine/threonine-protein kinase Nek1 [Exaiptasia diaphana]